MSDNSVMTRKQFLKKLAVGLLGVLVVGKFGTEVVQAGVSDNLNSSGGGSVIGTTPPANKKKTWIDTGNDGVMKYYDPESADWIPIRSTWDE